MQLADGTFRCLETVTRQELVDVVPAGMSGNATGAGIPIYRDAGTGPCHTEYDQATAARTDALLEEQRRRRRLEQENEENLRGAVIALKQIDDPTERLVRAIATFIPIGEDPYGYHGGPEPRIGTWGDRQDLLEQVIPEWRRTHDVGDYDDDEIAMWFAEEATRIGLPTDERVSWPRPRFSISGRGKHGERRGPKTNAWVIPRQLLRKQANTYVLEGYISEQGELNTGWDWGQPRGRLTVPAVVYLAARVGIPVSWTASMPIPGRPQP